MNRLTGKIKSLREVAERISVGELEMEIETKSRDEIGDLAEAIARIQDNIRLSIERGCGGGDENRAPFFPQDRYKLQW